MFLKVQEIDFWQRLCLEVLQMESLFFPSQKRVRIIGSGEKKHEIVEGALDWMSETLDLSVQLSPT